MLPGELFSLAHGPKRARATFAAALVTAVMLLQAASLLVPVTAAANDQIGDGPSTPTCDTSLFTWNVWSGQNTWALTSVTVNPKAGVTIPSGCTVAFSLNSYNAQGPTWATSGTQSLLDHESITLSAQNPTGALTVEKPACYGQTDFYAGSTPFDGKDGALPHYSDSVTPTGLIAWSNGGQACSEPTAPVLAITKTVSPSSVQTGSSPTVTYTLVVSNGADAGPTGDVVVTDSAFPTFYTITDVTCSPSVSGSCDANALMGPGIDLGVLAAGGSVTIKVTGTASPSAAGSSTNTADACQQPLHDVSAVVPRLQSVEIPSNCASASATLTVTTPYVPPLILTPGLSLAKTASVATFSAAGQSIAYTYTLKNTGQVTLYAPYAVADNKIVSVSCPSTTALVPGATTVCTGSYTTTAADVTAGSVTNLATGTAKGDPRGVSTVTSNQATATVAYVAPLATPKGTVLAATGRPQVTPPATDSVGGGSDSAGGGLGLLLLALAGLAGGVLALTPAASRKRR